MSDKNLEKMRLFNYTILAAICAAGCAVSLHNSRMLLALGNAIFCLGILFVVFSIVFSNES